VALCDISESISCSKVFNSSYGKGFGVIGPLLGEDHPLNQSNSVYGIIFYSLMGVLSFFNVKAISTMQVFFSVCSNLMSVYLGYILYFILDDMCVVCVSTYVINFLLLITSACKRSALSQQLNKSKNSSAYSYTPFYTPTSTKNNNAYKKQI